MAFTSQPKLWIEPTLSMCSELDKNPDEDKKLAVADIVQNPRPIIIKAPPQFGLTCLAHYIIREAWRHSPRSLWLYLDSRMLTPSSSNIKRAVSVELERVRCTFEDIKCVVLDSWEIGEKNAFMLLKVICEIFNHVPIIVMQTIDSYMLRNPNVGEVQNKEFEVLYLWALSRKKIRKVVNLYNDEKHIGDEDAVTSKVVADIDALNIHRTPLNCLTVLKASEVDFDESPVNRTEMLRRVLFILFNVDNIQTYKTKPDMKDCEYVLGYFCESMIRTNTYFFARGDFVRALEGFCRERVIDLDVQIVFDILYANHILVSFGNDFCFKFTYWVFYFAAQRMHHDQNFAAFIFAERQYARFPEIVEFYTGVDRRREDALGVLIKDLRHVTASVRDRCGLPMGVNPYKFIQWNPSPEALEMMQEEICTGISASNLPTEIKDSYADSNYDRKRPYNQAVRDFLSSETLVLMILSLKAAARALRNSDYVPPDVKRTLLREIMDGWRQLLQVLLVLTPLLAEKGSAIFDDVVFFLAGNFSEHTPEERLRTIFMQIPQNVVAIFKDDLFSQKMGPLLLEYYGDELDEIKKHHIVLLLIKQRPRGWKEAVQKYIEVVSKNSFYLFDAMINLRHQYEYCYALPQDLRDIEYLIKMSMAKHTYGAKKPGIKIIKKIPDSILPGRTIDKEADIEDHQSCNDTAD